MAQQAQTERTIDHDEIKQWVEERGGRPSIVADTRTPEGGMLRVDFGEKDEALEQVSWEDFFRMFEENDLAFVYEDETADGEISYFFRFVARGPEDEMAGAGEKDIETGAGDALDQSDQEQM